MSMGKSLVELWQMWVCLREKHVSNCVWKADGKVLLDGELWTQSSNPVDGLLHWDTYAAKSFNFLNLLRFPTDTFAV